MLLQIETTIDFFNDRSVLDLSDARDDQFERDT